MLRTTATTYRVPSSLDPLQVSIENRTRPRTLVQARLALLAPQLPTSSYLNRHPPLTSSSCLYIPSSRSKGLVGFRGSTLESPCIYYYVRHDSAFETNQVRSKPASRAGVGGILDDAQLGGWSDNYLCTGLPGCLLLRKPRL